jgi:hypothetical protein
VIEPDAAAVADLNQNSYLQAPKVLIRRKKYEMFREISTVQFLEMFRRRRLRFGSGWWSFCCAGN